MESEVQQGLYERFWFRDWCLGGAWVGVAQSVYGVVYRC